jgi:hypothetical protein
MPERPPSSDPEQWLFVMEQGCASDRLQTPATNYLAHVRRNDDGSFEIRQLEDHLRGVGDRVSECVLTCLGNIDHINQRIKVRA